MKIPLLSGELCREPRFISTPADPTGTQHTEATTLQVLVNRSFADTYPAGSTVIGHHLQVLNNPFLRPSDIGEVQGFVGTAREQGMNRTPSPRVCRCSRSPAPPTLPYLFPTPPTPL